MANTQGVPNTSHTRHGSNMSVVSVRATSLDVCEFVYGESMQSMDAIGRFYEPNASDYENPFLTATSRSVIADIQRLSRQLSSVDVPRPLAMFCTLFRLRIPQNADPLFRALRVWTEIGDICENESFDGHRKTIVEQTLNVLLLPGIHTDYHKLRSPVDSDSLVSILGSPMSPLHHFPSPSLRVPGTSLCIPSPFHFQLHIVTRLSFNELGRVTHHRDFWDVKDVIGLMPGVSLAQWVGTRLTALGLSYLSRFWTRGKSQDLDICAGSIAETADIERGAAPVEPSYSTSTKNALGLDGV